MDIINNNNFLFNKTCSSNDTSGCGDGIDCIWISCYLGKTASPSAPSSSTAALPQQQLSTIVMTSTAPGLVIMKRKQRSVKPVCSFAPYKYQTEFKTYVAMHALRLIFEKKASMKKYQIADTV
jgi:hypothetical protein